MKCCGKEMEFVGNKPNLGRRSIGKQFKKYRCQVCDKTKYADPRKTGG